MIALHPLIVSLFPPRKPELPRVICWIYFGFGSSCTSATTYLPWMKISKYVSFNVRVYHSNNLYRMAGMHIRYDSIFTYNILD